MWIDILKILGFFILIALVAMSGPFIIKIWSDYKFKKELKGLIKETIDLTRDTIKLIEMENAIMILVTYWKHGTWCFTDSNTGLVDEAFVGGADKQISYLVKRYNIINPEAGFRIFISATWFPDCQAYIEHLNSDEYGAGNYYRLTDEDVTIDGWYCPALFKYFATAPERIYCKVESL